MNTTLQFIITLLLSGVVAAIVSAVVQKRNEKESRLFNAKLDAYKEFATHLESRFVSLTRHGEVLDITTLAEVSAKCLLVSSSPINKKLKSFLFYVSEVYKRSLSPDYNEKSEESSFDKIWKDADKIENLMREDLGF